MADGPDGSSSERLRDYFKYISTVDAAAVVGALALREQFGLHSGIVALAVVSLGISAYLCVIAMFVLARAPGWAGGEFIDWLLVLTFSITTSGLMVLISNGIFGS